MKNNEANWKLLPRPWEFDLLILLIIAAFVWYAARLERMHAPPPPVAAAEPATPVVGESKEAIEAKKAAEAAAEAAKKAVAVEAPTVDEQGRKIFRPKPVAEDEPNGTLPDRSKRNEVKETEPAFEFDYDKQVAQRSWILILLVAVAFHVMLGRVSKAFISTPFWYIIAPAVFAVLGYMYVQKSYNWIGLDPAVYHGHWSEVLVLAVVFLGIGFLLARVRLQRVALSLRDEKWLAEVDAAPRSHFGLCVMRIQPILFPPARFKISENGILVVGWHYVAMLPYSQIKGVTNREKGNLSGAGFYLTKSFDHLVEIQLRFERDPVLIGPDKHDYFLEKSQLMKLAHHNT